jgi:hypothetical protein
MITGLCDEYPHLLGKFYNLRKMYTVCCEKLLKNPRRKGGLIRQCDTSVKGIVSPDWKGLQMISLDRFEV